jgi:hypothetical protein
VRKRKKRANPAKANKAKKPFEQNLPPKRGSRSNCSNCGGVWIFGTNYYILAPGGLFAIKKRKRKQFLSTIKIAKEKEKKLKIFLTTPQNACALGVRGGSGG